MRKNSFLVKCISILLILFIAISCVDVSYAKTSDITDEAVCESADTANDIRYIISIDGSGGDNAVCTSQTLRLSEPVIQLQLISRYASQLKVFRASFIDYLNPEGYALEPGRSVSSSIFVHENVQDTMEPVTNYIHKSDGKKR